MGRSEQPVPDGPLRQFAEDLRALRRTTGMTYRALARRAGYSPSVLSAAASGVSLPTQAVTLAYVGACKGDQDAWEARWTELAALLRATHPGLLPPDDQATAPIKAAQAAQAAGRQAAPGDLSRALAAIAQQREDFNAAALDGSGETGEIAGDGEAGESSDDGEVAPDADEGEVAPDADEGPAPSLPASPVPQAAPVMRVTRPSTAGTDAGPQIEPLGKGDPRRIGPFRTIGRLGGGAMGEVYLASSPAGRPVAVKLILPQLSRDPLFRRRFARELTAARTVRGGHTPAVVDADVNAERPWMATAYIAGPSLSDVVETHGALPEPVVLGLAAGVAEALADFHAAGIVHRDLKPSNVLLADDGPKVIDFGISRAMDGTTLTVTGVQVGTAGYMAPEQAEGQKITPAADVFALGCLLAYAATGIAPFGDGPSASVLYRIVHDAPDKDALALQDKQLRALIEACLDKDPQRRPTPAQIVERCSGAGRTGEGWLPATLAAQVARRSAHAATLIGRAARKRTIQRVRIGLAPLLLILAIVVTAVLLGHGDAPGIATAPPPSATPGPSDAGAGPGSGGAPGGTQPQGTIGTGSAAGGTAGQGGGAAGGLGGIGGSAGGNGGVATSVPATGGNAGGNAGGSAPPAAAPPTSDKYSFETGTENWGVANGSDVSLSQSSLEQRDGLFSLALDDTAAKTTSYVAAVSPALSDGPAAGTRVTAWIFLPGGSGQSVRAKLYVQNGSGNQQSPAVETLAVGWNELTYTTPAIGTITRVGVQVNKSGTGELTVYLDAVSW